MGGKNKAPPPPDYSGIEAANKEAAQLQYQLGRAQLDWAKDQYAQDQIITNKVINSALDTMSVNKRNAAEDRARYENLYQPLENQAIKEAKDFASPERQRYEMGRAEAGVGQEFKAARDAATASLESYGVDPSSTRFAAMDSTSRLMEGAAKAAAGNNARVQTEAMGRAMRSEAINVGRGYPGQIAQTYGTALQGGAQGANTQLAQTASGGNTMGTAQGYFGGAQNALNSWGNTLNQGYQNQLGAYNANQSSSSGLGTLLGAGLGYLMMADGGAVPSGDVTTGGKIPPEASPSNGKAIDDVPAMLTEGEFVLPKDVVQWKGEEWAQKEIMKAREAKSKAQAQPKTGLAPPMRPNFVSRPTGALPVG